MSQKNPSPETPRPAVLWVTVDEDNDGQRLDNFLMAQLRVSPEVSSTALFAKVKFELTRAA